MKKIFICTLFLCLFAINANSTIIGYANDTFSRSNCFRLGNSTTQGQAIRLSNAKLQALKGKSIDYAEFAVGSKQTTGNNMHVFIATSLDSSPIAEGTINITKGLAKQKWTLDKPYTITGDEENLYIGYTAEIATSYKILLTDGSYDINGCNFALQDGQWIDTFGMNCGSACISVNVDGADDYLDVIMGRNDLVGYFKASTQYDLTARFVNAGTTTINSFDAEVKVDGDTSIQHYEGLNIAPKGNYSFAIDGIKSEKEGMHDISVNIGNINDTRNDIDPSDNVIAASVFFYPHDMERALLIEGFTGQECSGCPEGHTIIENAIQNYDGNTVEISHHAGYYPDIFTMQEDADALFFYNNSANTYAPAVMVNRYADNTVSKFPVISTASGNIDAIMQHASNNEPYVSLNLETELDNNTRQLKVKLQIKPHKKLPSDNVRFNIYLVQDNIIASQAGRDNSYQHNRVSRGTLTGDSWGIAADGLTPGKVFSWESTVTIPEKIHSSFWTEDMIKNGKYTYKGNDFYLLDQVDIAAILKDMSVVAYVGECDNSDNSKNLVYNCCEALLGKSYRQAGFDSETNGIEGIKKNAEPYVYVANGKVTVNGHYDKKIVYSLSGKKMNADATLAKGIYIVKVVSGDKQTTKKVLVE